MDSFAHFCTLHRIPGKLNLEKDEYITQCNDKQLRPKKKMLFMFNTEIMLCE